MDNNTPNTLTNKTREALRELDQIKKTLKQCEHQLFRICREQTQVYLSVPFSTQNNFQSISFAIDDMKRILQGKSSLAEG